MWMLKAVAIKNKLSFFTEIVSLIVTILQRNALEDVEEFIYLIVMIYEDDRGNYEVESIVMQERKDGNVEWYENCKMYKKPT